ncbi:MAG: ATP-binding cassette domain-containing protein [Solirubrobacterales bacterium]|nr:ATP-binding cassette domain-containing protein [Solirubrobacterales bacterium]
MSNLLSIRGFSYRHPEANSPSLRDVNIEIEAGEFVLLTGPSGSGKSTLIRAACGLAPAFDGGTAAGELHVGGLSARDFGPGEIARCCGTVLQDPERQVVMTTVRSELALPLESRGLSATAVARTVEETALLLGLGELLDRNVSQLSGGELQRVSLGAALGPRPPLLLLDEPVSQLDPVAADDLGWLLRRLNEELGVAVLVAEQRLERLLPAADRVIALIEGRVACDASPVEFLEWAASTAPALQTPIGEMFHAAGLPAPPPTLKAARAELSRRGLLNGGTKPNQSAEPVGASSKSGSRWRRSKAEPAAIEFKSIWDERSNGRTILEGVSLRVEPGEAIAVMGRNGAGKSTLLAHGAGLRKPTRGSISSLGRVALLLQDPSYYLVRDRVGDLGPAEMLEAAGLANLADRHPRDLSGGERQRLALALVAESPDGQLPAALLLDEPTTGLDPARRKALADRLDQFRDGGCAIIVATHDAEFAAEVCSRVVLLGEGRVLADAPVREVLAGGWHFATETARVLDGLGGALLPHEGAALLRVDSNREVRQ